MSSSTSVLETLLKTNRPATDHERAIIVDTIAPTHAKLKVVERQISETIAYIEALKSQIAQAELKLHRLREEETAILDIFADHRRVFSPFRNLPEDVLREISVACVQGETPKLSYGKTSIPYILAQICRGMRHVALTTPALWASMSVDIETNPISSHKPYKRISSILARKASKWFERAGGLDLTIIIEDVSSGNAMFNSNKPDPTRTLLDALLRYATRLKEIRFISYRQTIPAPMIRIAALTAADVPLLRSVSLCFNKLISNPQVLRDSELLIIPTLRHVRLENAAQLFTVNWADLTSIALHVDIGSENKIGRILQQTKCLEYCDIAVRRSEESNSRKVNLPFLKTLIISEETPVKLGTCSILGIITAPTLEIFDNRNKYFDLSLLAFLKRSPHIWKLSIMYFDGDTSLSETMEFLRYCPSLTVLSLSAHRWCIDNRDGDRLLRAFVKDDDHGVICPRLQDLTFSGGIDFSLETLRIFLQGKHGDIATLNISPWRKVIIDIGGIKSAEKHTEIEDLVLQKNAEGLNVHVDSWRDKRAILLHGWN